jgi:hypothetical protein
LRNIKVQAKNSLLLLLLLLLVLLLRPCVCHS